ncbi:MAG TPA: hypothetical protein V6D20_02140, partial [Candidatus Obscuribacterales bacterium]
MFHWTAILLIALSALLSRSDACMAAFAAAGNEPEPQPLMLGNPVQGAITVSGFATPGSGVDPSCGGTLTVTTPARIYSWTASVMGQVNFSTGDNTCDFCSDTVLSAWYDNNGICTQVDCDDDGGPGLRDSLITFDAIPEVTYYIVVNFYSSGDGCLNLCPGASACPALPCEGTIDICPNGFVFDDLPELPEGGTCESSNGFGEPLGWSGSLYRYTIPEDTVIGANNMYIYFASIVGSDDSQSGVSDPIMEVWTSGCLPVGSNDDGFGYIGGSWVSTMATPGASFIIGSEPLSATGPQNIGTCMGYSSDGVAPGQSPCPACTFVSSTPLTVATTTSVQQSRTQDVTGRSQSVDTQLSR